MAEKAIPEEMPSKASDSNQEPPPLETTSSSSSSSSSSQNSKTQEPESSRGSKRRKNCPTALNTTQESIPPNGSFSFTFDTNPSGNSQETTPKFGSFNPVTSTLQKHRQCSHSHDSVYTISPQEEDKEAHQTSDETEVDESGLGV